MRKEVIRNTTDKEGNMYFIEEGKSFKIEFTEEEAKVIRQTKTLYFPLNLKFLSRLITQFCLYQIYERDCSGDEIS